MLMITRFFGFIYHFQQQSIRIKNYIYTNNMTQGELLKHLQEIQDQDPSAFDLNYNWAENYIVISFRHD